MSIPYIGFGHDELQGEPECREGDMVECPHCNHQHPVEFSVDTRTGKKTNLLGFYRCRDKSYLACAEGHFVTGLKPACSGRF